MERPVSLFGLWDYYLNAPWNWRWKRTVINEMLQEVELEENVWRFVGAGVGVVALGTALVLATWYFVEQILS